MGNDTSMTVPNSDLAAMIAANVVGQAPAKVTRFITGTSHYVYEAQFAGLPPVVVRIGRDNAHAEMAGAVHLSRALRPLGVPLPALLAHDIDAAVPWVVLERLPGGDLRNTIGTMSDEQLDRTAARVAAAQAIVAGTPTAGRYGYAVEPANAPHAAWSGVIAAHIDRSHRRLAAAQLFDTEIVGVVQQLLSARRAEIDAIAATPFLHDTTTKNVIIAPDGSFSGIVDVDDLCFGDPRYPAALTLAVLLAYGGPAHYVSAWLGHAGQADDAMFRLYVAAFLLDLMSEHGQVFNGNEQPSTPEARARLLTAFDANMQLAATEIGGGLAVDQMTSR